MVTIEFKSIPEYWEKEKDGRKPNTVRNVHLNDDRILTLQEYNHRLHDTLFIGIENTKTGEKFYREVVDVTFWGVLVIISWRHKDD